MSDSRKWAAEKEEEEWLASKEYAEFKQKKEKWNKLVAQASKMKVGDLKLADLSFLLSVCAIPEWETNPHSQWSRQMGDVDRLQRLVEG
jgi:hypothetical protein